MSPTSYIRLKRQNSPFAREHISIKIGLGGTELNCDLFVSQFCNVNIFNDVLCFIFYYNKIFLLIKNFKVVLPFLKNFFAKGNAVFDPDMYLNLFLNIVFILIFFQIF